MVEIKSTTHFISIHFYSFLVIFSLFSHFPSSFLRPKPADAQKVSAVQGPSTAQAVTLGGVAGSQGRLRREYEKDQFNFKIKINI